MIKYRLSCGDGHQFEGWFDNIASFESQKEAQDISCPFCANSDIDRAIMAPAIPRKNSRDAALATQHADPQKMMHMMKKMSDHVTQNYEYVGDRFADEARAIYYGEKTNRDIYGESTLAETQDLIEEGVPVAPLPMVPEKIKN